jgi:hypothetical protein
VYNLVLFVPAAGTIQQNTLLYNCTLSIIIPMNSWNSLEFQEFQNFVPHAVFFPRRLFLKRVERKVALCYKELRIIYYIVIITVRYCNWGRIEINKSQNFGKSPIKGRPIRPLNFMPY